MKTFRLACWLWGCICLTLGNSYAQKLDRVQGELILQLDAGTSVDQWLKKNQSGAFSRAQLSIQKALYAEENIWLLHFDHTSVNANRFLENLRSRPEVTAAQFNHLLASRTTVPDDPLFDLQWNWLNQNPPIFSAGDIDIDLAWDITQGGISPLGDTIVIALIDDGIDPDHPDLCNNLWQNELEIPNNGIDEDGNGYVDDHLGWNVSAEMDLVEFGSHGVKVAGILGAQGNNQKGISGLNWQVKIMPIVGISQSESEIIAGMVYALKMRQLYQASGGEQGAFVVAANFSWGMDGGFPEDAPIWCSFFDLLGQAGILSCAAATNHNWDVAQQGDLPTTCPSEFLLSITATDKQDQRPFGGYHPVHIDLAAPGHQVLTTASGNVYALASGTSFAAPHVSGLAALLYASNCQTLSEAAQTDPALTALWIKDLLLQGADQLPQLAGQVAQGRRINAFQSLQLLETPCAACPPPVGVQFQDVNEQSAIIDWQNPNNMSCQLRWRPTGTTYWSEIDELQPPFTLTTLSNCQEYEVQIRMNCQQGSSNFSSSYFFKTSGCCATPDISVTQVGNREITFAWNKPETADAYLLSYKPFEALEWETLKIDQTTFTLNGLQACTQYVFTFENQCQTGFSSGPLPKTVLTGGCDACQAHEYCPAKGLIATDEWIESVRLGSFEFTSGNDNGYGNFSGQPVTVFQDQVVELEIQPGFAQTIFPETYAVWADLDHNGTFDPVQELLAQSTTGIQGPFQCTLDFSGIPQASIIRLRIQMRWAGQENIDPCGEFPYGEVEDYCLQILPAQQMTPCEFRPVPSVFSSSSKTISLRWGLDDGSGVYHVRWRMLGDAQWEEAFTDRTVLELSELENCANFEWMVRKICEQDTTRFSPRYAFATDCPESTSAQTTDSFQASIFPNPFSHERVTLQLRGSRATEVFCRLFSPDGQEIWQRKVQAQILNAPEFWLDLPPQLPAGLYMLQIQAEERLLIKKIIRQ